MEKGEEILEAAAEQLHDAMLALMESKKRIQTATKDRKYGRPEPSGGKGGAQRPKDFKWFVVGEFIVPRCSR